MSTAIEFPVLLNVDIAETDSCYLIGTDISIFNAERVMVDVWQDSLIIEMETGPHPAHSSAHDMNKAAPRRYRRLIPLCFDINADELTTEVHNGTLAIRINKTSLANRRAVTRD